MRETFDVLNSKIKYLFKNPKKSFISRLIKNNPYLNSLYYGFKAEIAKKFLIKNPPYNFILHKQLISLSWDPIRYATIALAIKTINNDKIKGNFAELGVFRGESSNIIHKLAPERIFYLFDTFEGFPIDYLENKKDLNRFKDTRLDLVKKNLGNLNNIIIRKGIFPETSKGLESEVFSFVSIDADLYVSTLKGLEFFYPRVSRGGYIFIHDYHNPKESKAGVFRAVNEFMKDKPEKLVEISDVLGSVIIRKC